MSVMLVNADAGRIPLGDGVVHCSISSPPYFSLRQYTGDQGRDWQAVSYAPMPGLPALTVPPMRCPLGLEPDVGAFIGHLVLCYREVWRVLRDDGVCWIVCGDSFAGGGGYYPDAPSNQNGSKQSRDKGSVQGRSTIGLAAGNLLAVPYRLLLALQGDGWVIRNDCVWAKAAPMPESVAGWRWEHCGHTDDRESGHVLTVHHLNLDKSDCRPENLLACCQRCHLHIQARWRPGQGVMEFAYTEWMKRRGI
jgi:hypothetical protein